MKRNLKETLEELEETVTLGKVAVVVGLVTFGLLIYLSYVDWTATPMPKEVQVEMDRITENALSKEKVSVFQKAYLRNEFTKSVSMGGAGGMGNNVVGSRSTQDFVETIQRNNIEEVYCVYEIDGNRLTKRYWGLDSGGTHELRQVYTAPRSLYSIKEYTENRITFEINNDDVFLYWVFTVAIWAIVGTVVGLVARVVLGKAYPYHI